MKTLRLLNLSAALLVLAALPARAQFGGGEFAAGTSAGTGTVSASGMVTIEEPPEVMRLEIQLLAKGSNFEESLSILKDRKQAALVQLTVLGAEKDSVQIGPPKISSTKTDQQRQMEMMLAQRLRAAGRKPSASKKEKSDPVTLSAKLTAEWTLDGEEPEELLLEVYPLQQKIKEADLAGLKEASKLTAAEQELLEEAQGLNSYGGYGGGNEDKPGKPVFLFVRRISDEKRSQAMAEAYQKAKQEAGRIAQAADAELGSLRTVSSHSASGAEDNNYSSYGYNSTLYQALQRAQSGAAAAGDVTEALGAKPGPIKYNVTVSAAFSLSKP